MAVRLQRNLRGRYSRLAGVRPVPLLSDLTTRAESPEQVWQKARQRQPFPLSGDLPENPGEWFRARWPEGYNALMQAASAAGALRFTVFNRSIEFSDKIDWHYDPLTDRTTPRAHWTAIPYWRRGVCPGVKYIWELNRHQHFVTLGQAFFLTADSRFARALLKQWQGWLDDNPEQMGINWTSTLELGVRLISWGWAFQLVKESPLMTADFYGRLLVSVHQQAEYIRHHLSRHSGANNHILGECLGLIYAGLVFPELKAAAGWMDLGFSKFYHEFLRQVHGDGVIKEQSTCYQRYLFDYGQLVILAADAAGRSVPAAVLERHCRMAEFADAVMDAGGNVPEIGDSDDGQALLLDPSCTRQRGGEEYRRSPWQDLLGAAALGYGRAEWAWRSGGWSPALFWLFGAGREAEFSRLAAAAAGDAGGQEMAVLPPDQLQGGRQLEAGKRRHHRGRPQQTILTELHNGGTDLECRAFMEGGYAALRIHRPGLIQSALFDAGPLGLDAMAAHGHADALNFLLTAGQEPLLIDSGTFTYRGDPLWRSYFRSTLAHNCARIDGQEQSQIVGPFQWGRRAHARLEKPAIRDGRLAIAGEHDGFRRLGVLHRRTVSVDGKQWRIEDHFGGRGGKQIELFWHLAPCQYSWDDDHLLTARFAGCSMTLRIQGPASLRLAVVEGELAPPQGWFSPRIAIMKSNPVLCINTNEPLPVHIITEIEVVPQEKRDDLAAAGERGRNR